MTGLRAGHVGAARNQVIGQGIAGVAYRPPEIALRSCGNGEWGAMYSEADLEAAVGDGAISAGAALAVVPAAVLAVVRAAVRARVPVL